MFRKVMSVLFCLLALAVLLPVGAVTALAAETGINAEEITLYCMNSPYYDYISIPSEYPQEFQLEVDGGADANYYIEGNGCFYVECVNGRVTLKDNPAHVAGESYYITVTTDTDEYSVKVNIADYAEIYADRVMDDYIAANITDSMTVEQKLEAVCEFICAYDYSGAFSSTKGMIISGGGDCWASTDAVVEMCEKLGINAWVRNGNKDSGAGAGHTNALVESGRQYYEVEAGYNMPAPRSYHIEKRNSLFSYRFVGENEIEVYQYDGCDKPSEMTIPSSVDGYKVVRIASDFSNSSRMENVTKVIIPACITEIGDNAFGMCSGLTQFVVASDNPSYKSVGGVLYSADMKKLITYPAGITAKTVSVPIGVEELSGFSFASCVAIEKVELPSSVKTIGKGAFWGCSELRNINIPEGVSRINDNTFVECRNLQDITFPSSLRSIGYAAFYECDGLRRVQLPAGFETIEDYAFGWASFIEEVSLPNSIKSIGEIAFYYSANIKNIYYSGTQEDWEKVVIGDRNEHFLAAKLNLITPVNITAQPSKTFAAAGEIAAVSVEAEGEGLTYQWYICEKGNTSFVKSSIKDSTYGFAMSAAKSGRRVYCVVTDKFGSIATSDVVTMSLLEITKQPENATAAGGKAVSASITAAGDGLTYQWYACEPSKTSFYKSSITSDKYAYTMTAAKSGRRVYCTVTDEYGNSIESETVTLSLLAITKQPVSTSAENGKTASVSLTAQGEGLTYTWYYKNKSSSSFAKTATFKGNTYSIAMDSSRSGRQVYCVVADKFGNSIKTDVATLTVFGITAQPQNAAAAVGKGVSATVTATGEGLTYQWFVCEPNKTTFYKSATISNRYSFTMSETKSGRRAYCIVTDKFGSSARSDTVTLTAASESAVKITKQPVNVSAAGGKTASVSLTAQGEDLTYTWYYKNKSSSSFAKTSTFTGNIYSVKMDSSRSGRQVYCIVADKYGNSVKSNTVTLTMTDSAELKITKQPANASAASGKIAYVPLTAQGEGLTYTWYVLDVGKTDYVKSSISKSTYSCTMTAAKDGRKVYCVITDQNGVSVKSDTATLTVADSAED